MSARSDLARKYRTIELIEDHWDDIQVIVVTRESIEGIVDRKLTEEEWERVKQCSEWVELASYVWEDQSIEAQLSDLIDCEIV